MTDDEIITLAYEADDGNDSRLIGCRLDVLRRFARLVAAHERERCKADCLAQQVDVAATGDATDAAYNLALEHAVAAIRARGEK